MWIARHGIIQSGKNKYTPPLDIYTGASVAYSLRKLRSDYTGSAIRVRRSSDNAQLDIGFDSSGNLNIAALQLFVGSNDGFITTWYDQSGNGRNVANTNNFSNQQPYIIAGGILALLDLTSGKSAILFNNSNQRLTASFTTLSQPFTTFSVSRLDAGTGVSASIIYDSFNNTQSALYYTGTSETPNNRWAIASGTAVYSSVQDTANVNLFSYIHNGSSSNLYKNSTQILTNANPGTNGLNGLSVGNIRGNPTIIDPNYRFKGRIAELIIYPSNQTSNRAGIESNINSFYSIY